MTTKKPYNYHPYHRKGTYSAMIDIETMATTNDAQIISIGCLIFNTNKKHVRDFFVDKLKINVSTEGQEELGLVKSKSTMEFWNKQENKGALESLQTNCVKLDDALEALSLFLKKYTVYKTWANSPIFDIGILNNAYRVCGIEKMIPWDFRHLMDVRTVLNLSLRDTDELEELEKLEAVEKEKKLCEEKRKFCGNMKPLSKGDVLQIISKMEKGRFGKEIHEFDEDVVGVHDPVFDCYLQVCMIQNYLVSDSF